MKYSMILFLLTLSSCSTSRPSLCNRETSGPFVYKGTYYPNGSWAEDLFICYINPTTLSILRRAHDVEFAKSTAAWYADQNKLHYDNIECELVK